MQANHVKFMTFSLQNMLGTGRAAAIGDPRKQAGESAYKGLICARFGAACIFPLSPTPLLYLLKDGRTENAPAVRDGFLAGEARQGLNLCSTGLF